MIGCVRFAVVGIILASAVPVAFGGEAHWAELSEVAARSGRADPVVCRQVTSKIAQRGRGLTERHLNFFLFEAARKGCRAVVEDMLERGASLLARDRFGNTALLLAARAGRRRLVEELLARGADVEQRNLAGNTALLAAVRGNRRSTVKVLLAAKSDPNVINRHGVTPLAAAAFNGSDRILELLLDAGADPTRTDGTGKGAIVYAAARGSPSIVETLLAAGADVNAGYANDLTVLMWAAGHGNDVPEADGVTTVRLLLGRGAALDRADDRGRTALMIAAERGHGAIVAVLLEAGADRAIEDKTGKTAAALATGDTIRSMLLAP